MPIPETHIPRETTLVVAASDSLSPSADYVCDGTADEVEIQAAIDALPATGGKVILLEGEYSINASILVQDKYLHLQGTGHGVSGTKLKATVGLTTQVIEATDNTGATGLILNDLTIHGHADVDGLYLHNFYDIQIYGCFIQYCENGMFLGEAGAAVGAGNIWICNNWIEFNYEDGIHIEGNGTYRIYHNLIYDNGENGILVSQSSYFSKDVRNTIEGNTLYHNVKHGLLMQYCGHWKILGNDVVNNSDSVGEPNTYDGIHIKGAAEVDPTAGHIIVANNICTDQRLGAAKTQRYGIAIEDWAVIHPDYIHLFGNDCCENRTGGILIPAGLNPHGRVYDQHSDPFVDVLAASANYIVNAQNLVNGAVALTGTQPKYPRGLDCTITNVGGAVSAYTMTVVGINGKGETITEVFTFAVDGLTFSSDNAFDHVTSVTLADVVDTGNATFVMGIDTRLGLMNVIYETSDVWKIIKNGAKQVVAVAQVDVDYDIYDMSIIGLALNDDFEIWYRSNLNIVA